MLSLDPPKLLEFTWGDERLRFELTATRGHPAQLHRRVSPSSARRRGTRQAGTYAWTCWATGCRGPGRTVDLRRRWRQVIGCLPSSFGPDASAAGVPPEWEDAYGPAEG